MYIFTISVDDKLPLTTYRPLGGGLSGYAVEYVQSRPQQEVAVRYNVAVTDRFDEPDMQASVDLLDLRGPITGWVNLVDPSTIVQRLAPVFVEKRASGLYAYRFGADGPKTKTPVEVPSRGAVVYHPDADVTEKERVSGLRTVIYELNKYARNIINGDPLD